MPLGEGKMSDFKGVALMLGDKGHDAD